MNLDDLNDMNRSDFVKAIGWVYEHSPWVAERAWERKPYMSVDGLAQVMARTVDAAGRDEQLALLRAHPDLGARQPMAQASVQEQAGAGLDQLTESEHAELLRLNGEYRARFDFPFIVAVKGKTKREVLAELRERLDNDAEREWARALSEVHRIARFRLQGALEGS